jgi:hypothetical protein
MNRRTALKATAAATAGVLGAGAAISTQSSGAYAGSTNAKETLKFEVAEIAARFVPDETPAFEDGTPKYGAEFISQGYIYQAGTLKEGNGVKADGSPEFPDKVIGDWSCWGNLIGEGGKTTTGPMAVSTQLFVFKDMANTLVSVGYEPTDMNKAMVRAVTGGSGQYRLAKGDLRQTILFADANGMRWRFEVNLEK